ncbi:MAG: aldo/keto reductase [Eubacteriales bacterium]|nr:aldo/keto reductase [Eubacteriales bacterium]MDD4743922.1 aldo/keto reductase [Eubacteriales bacterium]
MLQRPYGKTKKMLSVIGFAGIIVMNETQSDANRFVAEALDQGINYFDVAPSYGDAQDKLGPALAGHRQDVFLACKTEKRTRKEAEEALNHSLKTLQTDYFDLYQLHSMTTEADVAQAFGPNGVMETVVKAQQEGKIRHVGFSAHSDYAAQACLDRFPFESVLFPLNWMTYLREGFGKPLVERAQKDGLTLLALKALARCAWPEGMTREARPYPKTWYQPLDDPDRADLALRFTLSLPVTAAVTPGDIRMFRLAMQLIGAYRPITPDEVELLKTWDEDRQPIFTSPKA